MRPLLSYVTGFVMAMALMSYLGLGHHNAEAQDLPVEYVDHWDGIKRLVIYRDDGTPAIILRTISDQPVIILLRPGETEEEAELDFYSNRTTSPRSIVGGDRPAFGK